MLNDLEAGQDLDEAPLLNQEKVKSLKSKKSKSKRGSNRPESIKSDRLRDPALPIVTAGGDQANVS